MNIKIKSAGVACLVGEDYDRVYTALKSKLSIGDLFTERIPGHEYLQWELPGDGWKPLSEGDPLMAQEVRQELLRRKQEVIQMFGKNEEMAQRILSVPDDSYVFYKADDAGRLLIRLTAWGYRYPERIGGGVITGHHTAKSATEPVCIHILYDNKPLPDKEFYVNGFKRITDASGDYVVGDLPIGYKLEIAVDGKSHMVDVQSGQGNINIDATTFTTVEVHATLDGQPFAGAVASLSYWGHTMQLTTDSNGKAVAKMPLDIELGMCTASLENETQQQTLVQGINVFKFNITTPNEEKEEETDGSAEQDNDDTQHLGEGEERILPDEEKPDENGLEEEKPEEGEDEEGQPEDEVEDKVEEQEEQPVQEDVIEESPEPLVKKRSIWSIILEVLAALLLLLLIVLTYFYCGGMLFG